MHVLPLLTLVQRRPGCQQLQCCNVCMRVCWGLWGADWGPAA